MQTLETDTITNANISSVALVASLTATVPAQVLAALSLSGLAGAGMYRACLRRQIAGAGAAYQGPTVGIALASGATTLYLPTTPLAVGAGDVVDVFVIGLAADSAVSGKVEWVDVTPPTAAAIATAAAAAILATPANKLATDAAGLADANVVKVGPSGSGTAVAAGAIPNAAAGEANGLPILDANSLVGTNVKEWLNVAVDEQAISVNVVSIGPSGTPVIQTAGDVMGVLAHADYGNSALATGIAAIPTNPYTGTPPTTGDIATATAAAILETPANLLATDASGRVTPDTVTPAGLTEANIRTAVGLATANLDTQLAGIAATVWGYTARTLSSFGSLVADIAAGVWSAVNRTLTAAVDSSGVTTLLARLTATRAGYLDRLTRIGTAEITVVYPILADGTILIEAGDDYLATEALDLGWIDTGGTWPDLTAATITFAVGSVLAKAGAVTVATGDDKEVRVALTKAETGLLTKGATYWYSVRATLANGHETTLVKRSRLQIGKALA